MKICLLADATCIHTQRIASGLAQRGHFVRVVSHKTQYIRGVVVDRFSAPRFSLRYPLRSDGRMKLYLRRLMREHDIVHMNFLTDWGLTRDIAEEGCLVVSPWGSDIVKPPDLDAYPDGLLEKRRDLLRMARSVVVYGHPFIQTVAAFAGLAPDSIVSVPLGVDVDSCTPLPEDQRRRGRVGFFKGFKAVYGPTVWIEAMPDVLRAVPHARFDLVGRGPMLETCRQLVKELGVEHAVTWVPYQPHEAIPDMLGSWSLSVMPSVQEAFGVAALECAAMETPVVASRVCGFRETVRDGETGILVEPNSPKALADGVIHLLNDDKLCRCMGNAGRVMVRESFDWPDCLDQLIEAFERAEAAESASACPVLV